MSANSVISVNSVFGRHLTVGKLPLASRRARGHVRLCASVEKAAAWLLLASWPRYKVFTVVVHLHFPSPVFPDAAVVAPSSLRHRRSAL